MTPDAKATASFRVGVTVTTTSTVSVRRDAKGQPVVTATSNDPASSHPIVTVTKQADGTTTVEIDY